MPKSLRGRAAAAGAAGLGAVVIVSVLAMQTLPLGAAFPLKALVLFSVVAAVATWRIRGATHPFPEFGRANQVTTARAVFVALVGAAIGEPPQPIIAIAITSAAMAVTMMDGVDGWIARSSGMSSAFGARLDMEVDALLIISLSVLAWTYGKAGAWVTLSGLLRYLFVVAGWIWPWMARPLVPSLRRQAICVVQIVSLIAVMEPFVTPPLSTIIAAAALAVLTGSFLMDTSWLVVHRREQLA